MIYNILNLIVAADINLSQLKEGKTVKKLLKMLNSNILIQIGQMQIFPLILLEYQIFMDFIKILQLGVETIQLHES